jgi:geranylgeranyl pyrophosphate synthase
MMHAATLIHDDLVDNAAQRRGQQTVNTRFSTSATVLAGDLAFAAAAQLGAATQSITVMQKFSETLQIIVNGEISYMFKDNDHTNLQAYYDWIYAKTASVFKLAAGMAATIGTASPAEIEAANQFGYNIGMAFQVTDDILDFIGDPAVLGKPTGNDLRQGTLTLPTLLYIEAHPNSLDISTTHQGNGNGQGHIEDLITSIRQSEAIEQSLQIADRFLQEGLAALDQLPETPERAELARLARQIANRIYNRGYTFTGMSRAEKPFISGAARR